MFFLTSGTTARFEDIGVTDRAEANAASRPGAAGPLLIGAWRVDPDANELAQGERSVRVEPKVMQVLLRLAELPGRVVAREELLDAAWPGIVVGDEALTQTIIKLRRALGDNPRAPTYVETIAKRGYRLIAPVYAGVVAAAAAASSRATDAGRARRRVALAGLALVTSLALLGAAVLALAGREEPVPTASMDLAANEVTVTVVPFEALGPAADQTYLARGISHDLVTDLSRLARLRVVRTGPGESPADARYVVTGSVQREGDQLRVNVQLADVRTRQQLWSERFERPFGDLFAVQDAITRGLVELLPGKMQEAARQRVAQRYTRNLAAYDHFLQGQAHFLVRRASDNEAARAAYLKAIELDPGFARAYAGLAMTHALDPRLRSSPDAAPALARALELAETAQQIDPKIPEVHWAIGFVHAQHRRHDKAIAALRTAIALNPSYADAYALMAGIHTYVGEPGKSIPLLRTALRLDAGGGYLYFMLLGRAYLFRGDTEQALINLREAATRNPVDIETRVLFAATLAAAGDLQESEWEAQEVRSLQPDFSADDWLRTYPLTDGRQRQRLLELLALAGI